MRGSIEDEVREQHALEAGLLWSLRDGAVHNPAFDLGRLAFLDERVDAHLDGLRLAGDAGWEKAVALLDGGEAGEHFSAAALALERPDPQDIVRILGLACADPALSRGAVSALGWCPFERVRGLLSSLVELRQPPEAQLIGVAAYAAHRQDPGYALGNSVISADPRVRARALRAVGELGRIDLLPELRRDLTATDDAVRFAAAWSAALFRETAAIPVLWSFATQEGPFAVRACDMVMRRTEPATACTWLPPLGAWPHSLRAALSGAAALGDPAIIPWLLEQAEAPEAARGAAWAFATITGIDLASRKVTGRAPEGFRAGPTDDPADEDVAMDPDENLVWPDAPALRAIWAREAGRFKRGTRYLLGQPMTPDHLRRVLTIGSQPVRAMAAIELSLREARRPVFEVRAPGFRQIGAVR